MKEKQALIITNQSGFLWKFEMDNVKLLQSLGYKVHYASNSNEEGYSYDSGQLEKLGIIYHNIEIARSPYMLKMNYHAFKKLREIIEREKIDVIHCHTPVGGVLGRVVGITSKIKPKVIYTAHGFHFYKGAPVVNHLIYKSAEYILAPLTDVLIVINEEDYKNARKFHLRKDGKICQLPGVGVNLTVFCPVSKKEKCRMRKKLDIEEDAFFALSVGEVNRNKNHVTAIRAVRKIKDDSFNKKKIVYGICGEGFLLNDLKNLVKELNLTESVRFFGYQNDIRDYYAAADVTVFPSIREGLGMAAIESLAMGVPVIASDNRGTREYMVDGKNGYICKYDDVEGFRCGLASVMNMKEVKLEEMSKYCVKSAQKFSNIYSQELMYKIYQCIDRGSGKIDEKTTD